MYELLTGELPFSYNPREPLKGEENTAFNDYLRDLMREHANEVCTKKPPSLRDIGIDVSEGVENMVLKCLEKDPKDRYQSIEELKDAIMACDEDEGSKEDLLEKNALFIVGNDTRLDGQQKLKVVEGVLSRRDELLPDEQNLRDIIAEEAEKVLKS
jgi:serine/threonine protein kinase